MLRTVLDTNDNLGTIKRIRTKEFVNLLARTKQLFQDREQNKNDIFLGKGHSLVLQT